MHRGNVLLVYVPDSLIPKQIQFLHYKLTSQNITLSNNMVIPAIHPILTGRNVEAENRIITASAATAVIGVFVFSSGHRAKKSGSANIGGWVGRVNYTPFRE